MSRPLPIFYVANSVYQFAYALPLYERVGGTFVVRSWKKWTHMQRYLHGRARFGERTLLKAPHVRILPRERWHELEGIVLFLANSIDPDRSYDAAVTLFHEHGTSDKRYEGGDSIGARKLRHYDYIFLSGPKNRERLRDTALELPESRLVEVGGLRFDDYLAGRFDRDAALDRLGVRDRGRPTVLYAPTWRFGNGTFRRYARVFIETLAPRFNLILRPHYHDRRYGALVHRLACVLPVDDLRSGVIRRHELTLPAKEEDRMRHTLWRVADPMAYTEAFSRHAGLYIADGHHRSASAERAARTLRKANPELPADAPSEFFLAVLFPAGELSILPYHRLVRDLGGLTPSAFLERASALGSLRVVAGAELPGELPSGVCAFYLEGRWSELHFASPASGDATDPVRSLDYDRVQREVFEGILGIGDPRTDPRVICVGGVRGAGELQQRVDRGEAALAVAMPATRVEDVLRVADAGAIMPPKSTWFEPKLRSGLLVHRIVETPGFRMGWE